MKKFIDQQFSKKLFLIFIILSSLLYIFLGTGFHSDDYTALNHAKGTGLFDFFNANPKIRGQGQGYRLIRKFSDFAKESLGLTEIIAVVKANNTQSIKSFIKAGFEDFERLNDEKKIKYKLNFD